MYMNGGGGDSGLVKQNVCTKEIGKLEEFSWRKCEILIVDE